MQLTSRRKKIAFFLVLGICLVALAVFLNVSWIFLHWRQGVLLFVGVIFFAAIILGLILNTGFLVREIRLNEYHDSFINSVTHELKTPITSIRLYLETLQRRDVDEAQRQQFYKLMLEDTDRLRGTVEQVLKAGEVRHASARKNWQEVQFSTIVREGLTLARLRQNLSPEVLSLGTAPADEIVVLGNPEEFRTAVFNLLDNAIKYSGDKKNIVVDLLTPNIDTVLLRVHDRGIGIPHNEMKRIFKRFYRASNSKTDKVKGTGLGLFIVRSIARRYGGDAFAESAGEGQGSTFTIRLPRVYHA